MMASVAGIAGVSHELVTKLMSSYGDFDSNGTIDRTEFTKLWEHLSSTTAKKPRISAQKKPLPQLQQTRVAPRIPPTIPTTRVRTTARVKVQASRVRSAIGSTPAGGRAATVRVVTPTRTLSGGRQAGSIPAADRVTPRAMTPTRSSSAARVAVKPSIIVRTGSIPGVGSPRRRGSATPTRAVVQTRAGTPTRRDSTSSNTVSRRVTPTRVAVRGVVKGSPRE